MQIKKMVKKTERENTMTRKNLEIIVPLKKFW